MCTIWFVYASSFKFQPCIILGGKLCVVLIICDPFMCAVMCAVIDQLADYINYP